MARTNLAEKTCAGPCGENKPVTEFYKNSRYSDGLFSYCKPCQGAVNKAWRAANPARHRDLVDAKRAEYLDRNLRIVIEHLLAHPCVDCAEHDPLVLQFDHVRGEKCFEIGEGLAGRNPAVLREEIAKCDVRCANCHQKRTVVARNTEKYHLLVREFGYAN